MMICHMVQEISRVVQFGALQSSAVGCSRLSFKEVEFIKIAAGLPLPVLSPCSAAYAWSC